MKEQFTIRGYQIVDFESSADVYVINTCTVTNLADRKSRQAIAKAQKNNPEAIIAVVGCYSQRAANEIMALSGVDIVAGTTERSKIVDLVECYDKSKIVNAVSDVANNILFDEAPIRGHHEKTRAVLKIQDGCSQFCAYCIIPYVRGPVRSRKSVDIIMEAKNLAEAGYKEIVLTGIHIASYGKDLHDKDLLMLISEMHSIEGIERLRLGSLDPQLLTNQFIAEASRLPKLCPHFHVSLQSGSDRILKRMNRRYTTGQFADMVGELRTHVTDVALTTDVMVGFPGETDEDFENTLKFVNDTQFSRIHVFKYSDRQSTSASTFNDKITKAVKDERSKRLIELGNRLEHNFVQAFIGKEVSVLVEDTSIQYENCVEGYTSNYNKVIIHNLFDQLGKIVTVVPSLVKNGVLFVN